MIEINRLAAASAGLDMKIKIIGLGGAGSNILDRLVLDGAGEVDLVAMNTDVQSLTSSVARDKVQIGRETTRGLGAGGDPEIGLAAAEESVEEIRQVLEGASIIFVCAGLGGGTGSGAAALVASLAKEQRALTVVFATLPFAFEGKRRTRQAEDALAALGEAADVVVCFENDKMGESVAPKAGIHQAFATADQTIGQSIKAICGLVRRGGLIHLGFDDLATALRNTDTRCLFGFGEAGGDNRAHEALAQALRNPLMDRGRMLGEAANVLVNVAGGPDMTLNEVQMLMDELNRHVGDQTQILFGAAVDAKLASKMSVTIISSIPAGNSEAAAVPRKHVELPPLRERPEHSPQPEPVVTSMFDTTAAEPGADEPMEQSSLEIETPGQEAAPAEAPAARSKAGQKAAAAAAAETDGSAASKPPTERQETLLFEPITRGRFEKSEPTIIDGEDLDVPTFLRRHVKVK